MISQPTTRPGSSLTTSSPRAALMSSSLIKPSDNQGYAKHQQEHRLLPGFLLVPSRKAVQVAQVHKSNIGLLFNINFNNITVHNFSLTKYKKRINLLHR